LEPTRDFNYIQNTVGGFIAAARSDQAVGEVFNIGSHYEISIGETVRLISEIMNVEIEIVQDPGRLRPATSEVQRLLADRRKAKKLLDWEPANSGKDGLRRGIEETIAWFCDPINLNKYKPDLYQV
jgi:dTDP-glucose 4,6-dehydratase